MSRRAAFLLAWLVLFTIALAIIAVRFDGSGGC